MIRAWLAARKTGVATAASGGLIAALVAAVAIVSTGYTAQKLELSDGSVWVPNGAEQVVGRVSTEVLALNTVVEATGAELTVVQDGATVLMIDHGNSKLDVIDPATSQPVESVPLPPENPAVFLAGERAVIHAQGTGEIWIVPVADIASYDPESEPQLSLGVDSVSSVDGNGLLTVFSPDTRTVYQVPAAQSDVVRSTVRTSIGDDTGEYAVTSVGGRWVVLDVAAEQLETAGGVVDLSGITEGERRLQLPSLDGDAVLVAHGAGLVRVPFDATDAEVVLDGQAGTPARPTVVEGCEFAAWTGGQAWRHCGTQTADTLSLAGMPGTGDLAFARNGKRVVLNESAAGASWAVQRDGELINNWAELIETEQSQETVEENDEDTPPELEKTQVPPVAVNDELGARPGRTTVLPVLLNDYDANGDVLVISEISAANETSGRIDFINQRQQLQLTLDPGASGQFTFEYTITDGRGGEARASVAVTVRGADENSAPVQARATKSTVQQGGRQSTEVLSDWVDPDGDVFYLTAASVDEPDTTNFEPDGTVVFTEGGGSGDVRTVSLAVTDGTAQGVGSLTVTVYPAGSVPIIAETFVVLAYAGQEITISPLAHVRGGNGPVRLNGVPEKTGATITPSYETGSFTFVSEQVRTHYLEYVVADDGQSVTGQVRVDVAPPADANTTPITVPKVVFVKTLSQETVDVAATDIDPAGGVLVVTDVMNVPADSGVRAEVLEQRSIRVTLTAPLESGSVIFNYRISNGLAEADGVVTVVEIPRPAQLQPPIANDDAVNVRVGDAIDIPVLSNDLHPDGEELTLNPALTRDVPSGGGLLFAAGNVLRYLAPSSPGVYTAVYEITGPGGQSAQAQLTLTVKEDDIATNNPPVPKAVTARVLAGEAVRIDIPLGGIDPDGDSVQLLGQEGNPAKGSVLESGPDYFVYEAGDYSAGTDSFDYTVVDGLGARATGTVRVGITQRVGTRNPIAVEDEVAARPGRSVSVQVLANDSDPDGSALTVTAVETADPDVTAQIVDEQFVVVTPPAVPGRYGLVYTIENAFGGSSSNFVTVVVSDTAPLAYPIARDSVVSLSDVLDRESIDVNVLGNVFFADGNTRELGLTVMSGYRDTATVNSRKSITVTITNDSQIIPFAVSHPDDDSIRAYAFIWVPGFDDALPQIDRSADPLTVVSEETLRINLNDYVVAVGGRQVRLTDSSTVRATNSDGSNLVIDPSTLQFSSADLYFGPASITFEVTDGSSASDPDGRTAILALPITVTPRENQPPAFAGATVEFEPGTEREFDLLRLTNYPYPDDYDELRYELQGTLPAGFEFALDGQRLTVRVDEATPKGTTAAVTVGVRDTTTAGTAGRIQLRVVPSTRPLASPAADFQITKRGQTTTIDVLANDQATNPFPGEPLRVVAIRGISGGTLPAGVSVTPSADNSRLTVTVSDAALPIDASLQYQVADASGDRDRYVWGAVTISVQDAPDAPVAPSRATGGYEEGLLTLQLTAPQFNNSPIIRYEVLSQSNGSYRHDCGLALQCALNDLTPGQSYQFTVVAHNAIGASEPSQLSVPLAADYLPAAPTSVTVRPLPHPSAPGSITIDWSAVPDPPRGSAVNRYVVAITGSGLGWSTEVGRDTTTLTTTANGGLQPGASYDVTVYARNGAQVTEADWRRSTAATVVAVGAPTAAPGVTAATAADGSGAVTVTWGDSSPNGAGAVTYSVGRVDGQAAAPACTPSSKPAEIVRGVGSGWTDSSAVDGREYTYFVYADNGFYCTTAATPPVVSMKAPGQASGDVDVQARGVSGRFDVRVADRGGLDVASGTAQKFQYRLGGGAWVDVPGDGWLTSAQNSAVYGGALGVEFRGCRDGTDAYCGPASDAATATPVNTRANMQECTVGGAPVPIAPVNPAGVPTAIEYQYSYNQPGPGGNDNWSGFSPSVAVPPGAIAVQVKATVTIGTDTWTDPGHGPGQMEAFGCQTQP
ncbi:Ig-like domain-containing protein [Salinibacterium sp. ZJ454]|uniref:Ig-like domain-containing protein n=1 Tax=Salinibacterium sp. ZJ454 TaxID=2708339 RepID=UPI0014244D1D|nr:Ig-like domain-containing protein [Salinibacterium sp. ZJ454]